jgi:hypothetical protein
MKIFHKERCQDGRRHIYFLGIKIFSYDRNISGDKYFRSCAIKYKAFMKSENVKTIVLGSSHGRDGFIPDENSFNLSNSSQDLYRAFKVYEYVTNIPSKCNVLKNIVLFWSVFHPGLQLEKTKEYLTCIPYRAFYNIQYPIDFPISDDIYVKQLKKLLKKIRVPKNYRGKSFWNIHHGDGSTSVLVESHLKNTKRNNNQIQYVEKMLDLARKHGHKLYIVLPPYRQDYLDCLPDNDKVYFELFDFLGKNPDVQLLDFQHDKDFKWDDFDSADHCTEGGAIKLTKKIKKYVK